MYAYQHRSTAVRSNIHVSCTVFYYAKPSP